MENRETNYFENFLAFMRNLRNVVLLLFGFYCVAFVLDPPYSSIGCANCYWAAQYHEQILSLKSTAYSMDVIKNLYNPLDRKEENRSYSLWSWDGYYQNKPEPITQAFINKEYKLRYQAWFNHKNQMHRILYNH